MLPAIQNPLRNRESFKRVWRLLEWCWVRMLIAATLSPEETKKIVATQFFASSKLSAQLGTKSFMQTGIIWLKN